ncbi:hypothetical protein FSP39_023395 [Pinctada imbricata]|uniref:Uncharacterized protein n=1 Tax=Pinctada imbricata TaxID=66713 RepID=A0AA89BPX3_PINIB|nr:hypothetical protein FSP39_023395 [Pinctada imbricata]
MLVSYSDEEADDAGFCLPRNLSYAEESYLNSYSVSSAFVNTVNKEKRSLYDTEVYLLNSAIMAENEVVKSCNDPVPLKVKLVQTHSKRISSDAEIPSQKTNGDKLGFYLNTTDDLDSVGSSSGKSNCSELELADTINSPDEYDLGKEDGGSEATFGEAISNALKSMELNDQYEEEEVKNESVSFASKRLSSPPPLRIQIDRADDDSDSDKKDPLKGSQKSLLDSPLYEDKEFNFNRTELRKSSSLKATKTPPGTPSRKKMVRFADAMGLDLESVRHVLNTDAPPKIPASATADLQVGIEKDRQGIGSLYLCSKFQQPGAKESFLVTVMTQKVSLENAVITDLTITGTVEWRM